MIGLTRRAPLAAVVAVVALAAGTVVRLRDRWPA